LAAVRVSTVGRPVGTGWIAAGGERAGDGVLRRAVLGGRAGGQWARQARAVARWRGQAERRSRSRAGPAQLTSAACGGSLPTNGCQSAWWDGAWFIFGHWASECVGVGRSPPARSAAACGPALRWLSSQRWVGGRAVGTMLLFLGGLAACSDVSWSFRQTGRCGKNVCAATVIRIVDRGYD
jgi:hypothetical protein